MLSHLYREVGKTERAIEIHRALVARRDLTRAERAYALASLGTDYRKAGFLDRAARGLPARRSSSSPGTCTRSRASRSCHEDQRQWREAFEIQTRIARMRKSDDALVLGFLQTEMGKEALARGPPRRRRGGLPHGAVARPPRLPGAPRARGPLARAGPAPRRAGARGRDRGRSGARLPCLRRAAARLRRLRRALALRRALRAARRPGPARLARPAEPRAPAARRGPRRRGARPAAARGRGEPARPAGAPRGVAHAARARRSSGPTSRSTWRPSRSPRSTSTRTSAPPAATVPTTCSGAARTATSGTRSSRSASARRLARGEPGRPASLLAALLAATLVIRPLAHGVPLATVLVFWATVLGQVVVPGVLLVRGARLTTPHDRGLLLGQGASLGLALQGLSLLAGRALGAPWLPTGTALARDGARLVARAAAPRTRPPTQPSRTSALPVGVVLLAACCSRFRRPAIRPRSRSTCCSTPATPRSCATAGRSRTRAPRGSRWPITCSPTRCRSRRPIAPRAAVADPLLALAPLLWITLLALQTANAGRLLFGSVTAGAIGAALLVLHTDPARFARPSSRRLQQPPGDGPLRKPAPRSSA